MNKQIKSLINKHCYKLGLKHYEELRKQMITRATTMAKSGMAPESIISALDISTPQDSNKNAQEAAKCPF